MGQLSCQVKGFSFCQRTTYLLRAQVEVTKTWGEENKRWKLFITRFYKCHFCFSGHTAPEELKACHTSFQEHYEFAFCRFHRYLHWSLTGEMLAVYCRIAEHI